MTAPDATQARGDVDAWHEEIAELMTVVGGERAFAAMGALVDFVAEVRRSRAVQGDAALWRAFAERAVMCVGEDGEVQVSAVVIGDEYTDPVQSLHGATDDEKNVLDGDIVDGVGVGAIADPDRITRICAAEWEIDAATSAYPAPTAQIRPKARSSKADADAIARASETGVHTTSDTEGGCNHTWVDARNSVVLSGEVCLTCGALRAGNQMEGGTDA